MQVIAERELEHWPSDGSEPKPVIVRFGMPVRDSESDNWRVALEVHGLLPGGEVFSKDAFGVDSTQAIIEAFWLTPVFLNMLLAAAPGRLTYLGDDDLGFHRSPPAA